MNISIILFFFFNSHLLQSSHLISKSHIVTCKFLSNIFPIVVSKVAIILMVKSPTNDTTKTILYLFTKCIFPKAFPIMLELPKNAIIIPVKMPRIDTNWLLKFETFLLILFILIVIFSFSFNVFEISLLALL